MQERPEASHSLNIDTQISNSGLDKLGNELSVFSNGLSQSADGIAMAAHKAVHDPATLWKVGTSTAMGLGIGILAGRTGTLGLVGRGIGIAAGASFLLDGVKPFYNAWTSTWNATRQSQIDRAGTTLGNSIGAFAVDFAIQTPGAILGGGLAGCFESGRGPGLLRQPGLLDSIKGMKSGHLDRAAEPVSSLSGIDFRGALVSEISSREPLSSGVMTALDLPLAQPAVPGTALGVDASTAAPLAMQEQHAPQLVQEAQASSAVPTRQSETSGSTLAIEEKTNYAGKISPTNNNAASNSGSLERVSAQRPENGLAGHSTERKMEPVYGSEKAKLVSSSGTKIYGFDFVEIKPTDTQVPDFDMGVGIDDSVLLAGRRNLEPRNAQSNMSVALRALYCTKRRFPSVGSTLAISERTPDSLTALAVLANRAEKRRVSESIVKLIADRGKGSLDEQALKGYKAISFMSEQEGVKVGDRVRFIRAVLDGTVTPADLNTRAIAYDTAHRAAIPEEVQANKPTGVRSLGGQLLYSYHQTPAREGYEYALGVSDPKFIGTAKIIDQQGPLNIVQRAMQLSDEELPPAGAGLLISEVDVNRLSAAAILENRQAGTPMRKSLIDFILRRGTMPERINAAERENVVAAYQAMEGFSNDPHLAPHRKIAAVKNLLSHDVPAAWLKPIVDEFAIFRPSEQPFKYVRTTKFKPKPFDFGVEITSPELVKGQPNLLHPESDTPSAAEQALKMPQADLPKLGDRVSIEKPDADALTAVAVMANRVANMPVNERLVEAVGRRDRGLDTDPSGNPYTDIEAPFVAIRSFARNKNILLTQRISAIRALLAGTMREGELRGLVDRFNTNQWAQEVHAEKTSTITEPIPGKLAYVETPMENWYSARDLGLKQAPVAVIAATERGRTHFEVLTRASDPAARRVGSALPELQALEPGWGGHDYIFVSPSSSKLTSEQVLGIIARHAYGADASK